MKYKQCPGENYPSTKQKRQNPDQPEQPREHLQK